MALAWPGCVMVIGDKRFQDSRDLPGVFQEANMTYDNSL
jgi:hypothetical protein